MNKTKTPFVYWAQDKKNVFFKIDLQSVVDLSVNHYGNYLECFLKSNGENYSFSLKLYGNIKLVEYKKYERKIDIVVIKKDEEFWPSIIEKGYNERAPYWLKIDFDRWKPGESSEEENTENFDFKNFLDDISNQHKNFCNSASKKMDMFYNIYLCAYNVCMLMVFFYVLVFLIYSIYLKRSPEYKKFFWSNGSYLFFTCIILQFFDIIHSIFGLIKSNWLITLLQVIGRLIILFIINGNKELYSSIPVHILLLTYFISEQFRYSYYALTSLSIKIKPLTWLRFSNFLLLYPIGFVMEVIVLLKSIPFYYDTKIYSLNLPNSLNISFNFGVLLSIFAVAIFPYGVITFFDFMKQQRIRKLKAVLKKLN